MKKLSKIKKCFQSLLCKNLQTLMLIIIIMKNKKTIRKYLKKEEMKPKMKKEIWRSDGAWHILMR